MHITFFSAAALVALCATQALAQCDGGEIYDPGSVRVQNDEAQTITTEWVQLFTPPSVPWQYETVCMWLIVENPDLPFNITYYEEDPFTALPADTPSWFQAYTAEADYQGSWATFNVSFVASRPRGYIGISILEENLDYSLALGIAGRGEARRNVKRVDGEWVASSSDTFTDVYMSALIRAAGFPDTARDPPATWNCSASRWADGSVCDCGCGDWDPDCHSNVSGPLSASCTGAGAVCSPSGECVIPGWTFCNLSHYGAYDGCQCGCGSTVDPDCAYDSRATNCPSQTVPLCQNNTCKEAWSCAASKYGDGQCNCGCGYHDSDCNAYGNDSDCANSWLCLSAVCRVPADWTCNVLYFNHSDECDCECGDYDLDCDTANSGIIGCNSKNFSCSYNGSCIKKSCGNGYVESASTEECDGGANCSANCTCLAGYVQTSPRRAGCVLACGNGVLDESLGEECDSGSGCELCRCKDGYHTTSPLSLLCAKSEQDRKLAIGLGVGLGGGGFLVIAAISGIIVSIHSRKRGRKDPRPINLPLDDHRAVEFVPTDSSMDMLNSGGITNSNGAAAYSTQFAALNVDSTGIVPPPQTPPKTQFSDSVVEHSSVERASMSAQAPSVPGMSDSTTLATAPLATVDTAIPAASVVPVTVAPPPSKLVYRETLCDDAGNIVSTTVNTYDSAGNLISTEHHSVIDGANPNSL